MRSGLPRAGPIRIARGIPCRERLLTRQYATRPSLISTCYPTLVRVHSGFTAIPARFIARMYRIFGKNMHVWMFLKVSKAPPARRSTRCCWTRTISRRMSSIPSPTTRATRTTSLRQPQASYRGPARVCLSDIHYYTSRTD